MADINILKEFLVSLGFQIDASSEKKWRGAVVSATRQMQEFGKTMTVVAASSVAGVIKIANGLEELYWQSQRTQASGVNIKAFGYAVSQLGGSAEGAVASLESLARNMRNSPGYEGLLTGLGVQTRQANGELRDTVQIVSDLGQRLADMPYYQANAYANTLGLDEKTLMALRDGSLTREMGRYKEMSQHLGIYQNDGADTGRAFMLQLRELWMGLRLILQKVAMLLAQLLLPGLQMLVRGLGNAARWFAMLDPRVRQVLKLVVALAAGFVATGVAIGALATGISIVRALTGAILGMNAVAALNPIAWIVAAVVALGVAIGLLWDDYQTWKEGSASLIDWGAWKPEIDAAIAGFRQLSAAFEGLGNALTRYLKPVAAWLIDYFGMQLKGMLKNVTELVQLASSVWRGDFSGAMEHGKNIGKNAVDTSAAIVKSVTKHIALPDWAKDAAKSAAQVIKGADNWARGSLGALISRGEGDYDSVNLGAKHGYRSSKKDLANMTLAQVMQGQDQRQFNAVGRYQMIRQTLKEAAKAMGLRGDEKFDAGLQDRIFNQYLLGQKRKQIADYLQGKSNDLQGALLAASKEWASVASPMTGRSYYAGTGNNHASISVQDMTAVLNNARANYQASQGPVINQTTHVTVHGAEQARETAQSVADAQNDVNARLARNFLVPAN